MQCPSFNRCSSGTLEDTAARVVAEFGDYLDDDVYFVDTVPIPNKSTEEEEETQVNEDDEGNDDDSEFEFPSLFNGNVAPLPADEFVFPIFGRDLIEKTSVRNSNPLWKLMREERESPESCSSSEADELDGVPEDMYCVWSPSAAEGRCRKSRSAGSKRWKIRDLVRRSNSDGRGNSVFSSPAKKAVGKGDLVGGVFANVKHFRGSFPPV